MNRQRPQSISLDPPRRPEPCLRAWQSLHAWLDGEQPQPPTSVRDHRTECSRCRSDWELARAFRNSLQSLPAPMVPFGLSHRIVKQVEQDRRARRRRGRRIRAVALVAASVLLLVVLISGPRSERRRPEVANLPAPRERVPNEIEKRGSLRVGLAMASRSVATGVGRATEKTVSETKKIITESGGDLPKTVPAAEPVLAAPTDPASESLDELENGATVAFRPVTSSTRRAFGLVLGSYVPRPEPTPPESP